MIMGLQPCSDLPPNVGKLLLVLSVQLLKVVADLLRCHHQLIFIIIVATVVIFAIVIIVVVIT